MPQLGVSAVAVYALVVSSAAQYRLQPPPPISPKLIKAGRILDVASGKYVLNQGILTDQDKIRGVGPWEQVRSHAPSVAIIDLSQATVLPGLIDCHSHMLVSMPAHISGGEALTTAVSLMSPEFRTLLGAMHARDYLEAGVTAVRVVGHSGVQGDIALRDAIKAGLVSGPRIQAAGRKLTPPGGQATYLQPALAKQILEEEYIIVSGPDEARKAVRENLAIGADIIKLALDSGAGPFWKFRYLAPDEVKAATDDAHRLHMRVAAHAVEQDAIQTAIDAGVDSIEHAFLASDAELAQMRDKGIFLVATDIPENGGSPESKDRLQRAMKLGLTKIAIGSDLWFPPATGRNYGEAALDDLKALRDEGMANVDIIRAATVNGAELLGWSDKVGQIAPGKFADLIALSADPLQDVTSLQHVRFVMKGSIVIKNEYTVN
jgi:imidazolonepropionase-like amidohydrolase